MTRLYQLLFCFYFFCLPINQWAGQSKINLAYRLGFVKNRIEYVDKYPLKIHLGLQINQSANYKILFNDHFMGGGAVQPGMNIIDIPAHIFMEQSSQYKFHFLLKKNGVIIKKEFMIISTNRNIKQKQEYIEMEQKQYTLSMYLKNDLISQRIIRYNKNAQMKTPEFEPSLDTGGMDRTNGTYPALYSVNFVNLAAAILRKIKQNKLKAEAKTIITYDNLTLFITSLDPSSQLKSQKIKLQLRFPDQPIHD